MTSNFGSIEEESKPLTKIMQRSPPKGNSKVGSSNMNNNNNKSSGQ